MKKTLLALLALVALPSGALAQTVTVKLGTMAPDGSAWHGLIKEMGERWSQASGGKVKLKVYAGGVAGNEGDMVRKLRVGQLNAAALSVVGLHDIETSAQALGAPGLLEDSEYFAILEKMAPTLEKRILDKGFQVLLWGDAGNVYMFFNKEIKRFEDVKGTRVFAWAGDPASVKAWELAGFQPVVISSTDIVPSLQTGMIQGFGTSAIMSFTARWYDHARYMVGSSWGHLPGATIINKDVWEKIPADLRPQLMSIAREIGVRVTAEVVKMEKDAIAQMAKNGLTVVNFNDVERRAWVEMAEKTWPAVRGGVCTAEAFDEVKKVRDEYRATVKAAKK